MHALADRVNRKLQNTAVKNARLINEKMQQEAEKIEEEKKTEGNRIRIGQRVGQNDERAYTGCNFYLYEPWACLYPSTKGLMLKPLLLLRKNLATKLNL